MQRSKRFIGAIVGASLMTTVLTASYAQKTALKAAGRPACAVKNKNGKAATKGKPALKEARRNAYAIVFACDYKGAASPLYSVVQYDAIRAYRTLVVDMGFAPDHIVLLAEGESGMSPLQIFLRNSATPPQIDGKETFQSKVAEWKNAAKPTEGLGQELKDLENGPEGTKDPDLQGSVTEFRNSFLGNTDNAIPVSGAPTAQNFRLATQIISHLANSRDSVTVVIAARGGPNPTWVYAKPQQDGKTDPADNLKAEDIALPNCKAGARMLLMDNSLRNFDENLVTEADGTGFGSKVKSAFAGDTKSVVMLASDGTGISWPALTPTEDGKFTIVGSAFLHAAFAAMHGSHFSTAKEYTDKAGMAFRLRMSTLRTSGERQLGVKPVGYKAAAPLLVSNLDDKQEMIGFLNAPQETASNTEVKLVSYARAVTLTEVKNKIVNGQKIFLLRINNSVLGAIPQDRVPRISQRLRRLLEAHLTQQQMNSDVAGIHEDHLKSVGEWVVTMPRDFEYKDEPNVRHLLTVDEEFARIKGEPALKGESKNAHLERVARKAAKEFRIAMTFKGQTNMMGDETTADGYMGNGIALFGKGDYVSAAQSFQRAISQDSANFLYYVWLSRSYLEAGQKDKARQTMQDLRAALEDAHIILDPATEKEAKELESRF